MRFVSFLSDGQKGLAVIAEDGQLHGLLESDANYPGDLESIIARDELQQAGDILVKGPTFDMGQVEMLPPVSRPAKIFCLGINYKDHAGEAGIELPDYPTIFSRYSTSLIGHNTPIIRAKISDALDYEGELVAVVGRGGRHISEAEALDHVAGYSVFNDATFRDYQLKTTQWQVGKTFDGTGAFGPSLVTPDELPKGASGLSIETRVNGEVVQKSNTDQLIFTVAKVISLMSETLTLEPGDVFIMGTPSGVGHFRQPQLYLKPGDVCEVEIEKIGLLSNTVKDEE